MAFSVMEFLKHADKHSPQPTHFWLTIGLKTPKNSIALNLQESKQLKQIVSFHARHEFMFITALA